MIDAEVYTIFIRIKEIRTKISKNTKEWGFHVAGHVVDNAEL
jgi:hypothetical protein